MGKSLALSLALPVLTAFGAAIALCAQDASLQKNPQALAKPDPVGAVIPTQAPIQVPEPPLPAAGDPLFAPVATSQAQSLHDKFMDYAMVSYGPRALFTPAIAAGIRMANPPKTFPRNWRLGAEAFGINYANAAATATAMHTGRFLTGALLHEDFRYRPSISKHFVRRAFHAVSFTFVDKSDAGHNRIAVANFVGAASGGFVGNLYLPPGFNNAGHAETRTAFLFGGMVLQNVLREFAPDILEGTHWFHIPFPRIPVPEWWVKR